MKSKVQIGNEMLPSVLQTTVLQRFMTDKALLRLYAQYKENLKSQAMQMSAPSELEKNIAHDRKKGLNARQIASKYGVPMKNVYWAIRHVALFQYLNS